jgi:hypothetical protein
VLQCWTRHSIPPMPPPPHLWCDACMAVQQLAVLTAPGLHLQQHTALVAGHKARQPRSLKGQGSSSRRRNDSGMRPTCDSCFICWHLTACHTESMLPQLAYISFSEHKCAVTCSRSESCEQRPLPGHLAPTRTWLGSRAVSLAAAVSATSSVAGVSRGLLLTSASSASTTPDSLTDRGGSSGSSGPPRPAAQGGGAAGVHACRTGHSNTCKKRVTMPTQLLVYVRHALRTLYATLQQTPLPG